MSASAKSKPSATEAPSVETALASAFVIASRIISELRSPTATERAQIDEARERASAAGIDVGPMFSAYVHHLAIRDDIERGQAREAAAREERERVRANWLERPARFRSLPEAVQVLYLLEEQVMSGGQIQAADMRRAFIEVRREITSAPSERHVPVTFEPETIKAAREAGATRDGVQGWGTP